MLSGVTVKPGYYRLCSAGGTGLKWHFHFTPHRPVPIRQMLDNNYSVKHLMNNIVEDRKLRGIEGFAICMSFSNEPAFDEPNTNSMENALSLRYPETSKIFPLLSTLYIRERDAGKICMHFWQFSETTALCCKNISIMPALCLMLQIKYYAQNYAGIIRQTLVRKGVQKCCRIRGLHSK